MGSRGRNELATKAIIGTSDPVANSGAGNPVRLLSRHRNSFLPLRQGRERGPHAHVNYEYPYSAYLLLQCMLWTLCPSVPIRQGEWRSDLDTLLFLLAAVPDVHGPRDAAVHQEEFSTWDHTDVRLVRAWLDIVSQCTFVRECCRDESEKARSFWDALLRRHDGGEKTSDIA